MYDNALEFLDEERDAWRPFEALADLPDEAVERAVATAHGWSGRTLMGHLLAWQRVALDAAKELSVGEAAPAFERADAKQDGLGIDSVNERIEAEWATIPLAELRDRFRAQPGELRGQLTVVPETRWLKNGERLKDFLENTTEHYDEHRPDLDAVLAAARP